MIVGENRSKLNPTAHFPSVYIAGNTFGENAMKKHKANTHYPADKKTVEQSKHVKICMPIAVNHGMYSDKHETINNLQLPQQNHLFQVTETCRKNAEMSFYA
jgi:hypothetical protein